MLAVPTPIGLVQIGIVPDLSLHELANTLNGMQNVFVFHAIAETVVLPAKYPEGAHHHPRSTFFELIKTGKDSWGYTNIVGVTRERLDDNCFNLHNAADGVGVVTIDSWEKFRPAHIRIEQYVAYLILCEVFCITSKTQLEHNERKFCLFDFCQVKEDLIECLKSPLICTECLDALHNKGFNAQHIDAANKILGYAGKRSFWYAIKALGNNFITGALVSAIIVGLVVNQANATLSSYEQWVIIGFLILIVLFAIRNTMRAKK